jgi:16S rRNA (guanine966-N2)-methyltransferase
MRIISGFLKGKKIDFLKSSITRPLRDFVKENIFNILNHSKLITIPLKNIKILDLYSGVGSFGIECISRQIGETTFVERDKTALNILKKNIKKLDIENKTEIFEGNVSSCIEHTKKKFDIIFLDPPFAENFFINDLKNIKKLKIINRNHLVVIHREKKSEDDLGEVLTILLSKNYGRSKILFGKLT